MITILAGANSYALRARLHELTRDFIEVAGGPDMAEMAMERLDGEESSYERMQEALQSLPFLASRKLVVLHTPGANKEFAEKAAGLLEELPETTDLIIIEPKLDKRLAYYKLLKKQKGFKEFPELDENGLARWLVDAAAQRDAKLSPADARALVERVGTNQQYLAHEIEKLSLGASAAHAAGSMKDVTITRWLIDDLTAATPSSTIFQLLEAAFAGNTRRALELYAEQRALRVEPQQIIAMLAWQLHVLALVSAAGPERPADIIAKEAKLSPYVVKKTAGIARTLSLARVRQLVTALTAIDERLKRERLNADDVLLEYLVGLAYTEGYIDV
jgi:DNA polymerase-3 subunit delta